jgi:hypothetical protein
MEAAWFTALFSAICLEGLGRRYLPFIPSVAFYFLKDVILAIGYLLFRPAPGVSKIVSHLYRGFGLFWIIGFVWTVIEVFNPRQTSPILALVGLRAYWVWWFAPALIAQILSRERNKRHAIYVFLVMSMGIAVLAALQFAAPSNSSLNLYTVQGGEEIYAADMAVVGTTGRARVASTFSFLSGFQDFTILVPALLLALGLEAKQGRFRNAAFLGTFATAAVLPMSGSRSGIILGAGVLLITAWTSGLFFTRVGRRVLIGGVVAAVLSVTLFPDAILGVQDRFQDTDETHGRYMDALEAFVPPLAIAQVDGPPFLGVGTGMQQNARASMHVEAEWNEEIETRRYIVELGPIGFLAIWFTKVGLMVALFRAARILKRVGRRGAAAAATSYAVMTLFGSLTYDHVWQALYFLGCGFILAEVVSVSRAIAAGETTVAARPPIAAPASAPAAAARSLA